MEERSHGVFQGFGLIMPLALNGLFAAYEYGAISQSQADVVGQVAEDVSAAM